MERVQKFLGTWILQPEECRYESGEPPISGMYSISLQDETLWFQMVWTTIEGKEFKVEYCEIPDGEEHPYENKQLVDSIRLTPKSATVLESEGFKDDLLSMRATRELIEEDLMKVTFEGMLPEGQSYYNISVYKRYVNQ
jgi:hypothetical protein